MATANAKKDEHATDEWRPTRTEDNQHRWSDSSEHDGEDDNNEFFDAPEVSAPANPQPEFLHKRLNEQLPAQETVKPKSPGSDSLSRSLRSSWDQFRFLEDPYFIDEDALVEREALLTDEEKEVKSSQPLFLSSFHTHNSRNVI